MSIEVLLVQLAVTAILAGYSAYKANQLKKRAEAQASDSPSPIPYITESDVIPVVFGTVEIVGTGIVEATGPRKRASSEPELSRDDIDHWWEWNYVRVVLCHGQVDNVSVYIDNVFADSLTGVGYPLLQAYGGKTTKQILLGWSSNGPLLPSAPPSGAVSLADLGWQGQQLRLPGIAYALMEMWQYGISDGDGVWSAKPQFPDGVSWRVQRINYRHGQTGVTGWTDAAQWQPSLAMISPGPSAVGEAAQMNPAHILREILTDRVWGMGQDEALIDETSFAAAAAVLHGEDFGLSYLYAQETSAADFAAEILRHIDGLMYQEPSTGLYVLKLVRTDSNALHDITSEGVVTSPPEYSRPSYDKLVTRVTVIYRSLRFKRERSISVHDQALTEQLGDIPVTIRYDGVYSPTLAAKLAGRDLRRLSTPLATLRVSVNWDAGKDIRAGDRVQWRWPSYGIFGMRLRVVGVTYGELDGSSVTLDCIEDVLTSLQAVYATPVESLYTPPNYDAVATTQMANEVPRALAGLGNWPTISDTDTRGGLMVAAPVPGTRPTLHVSWDLMTNNVTRQTELAYAQTFTTSSVMGFSGITTGLVNPVMFAASFTPVSGASYLGMLRRPDGTDEFVLLSVSGINLVVSRGVYDTTVYYGNIPSGTVIYVIGANGATSPTAEWAQGDGRIYVTGATVATKAITRTSQEVLDAASATTVSVTTASRQVRPMCPGFTAVSFVSGTGTTISWRRRNRLTNPACTQTCPDVTPETGTTHRLIIEGLSPATGGVFVQVQDLTLAATETSYLYTTPQEDTDHKTFPGGAGNFAQVRMTLYSLRDGYESWQRQIRVRS